ncbi:MAG: 4Fe-4S dicluster domain-containing protein [Calditrichaeota bacterium]|nr:MAG: 4Fe-4S dicluster domain-containing protein [Calditrichota bacterium]
MKTKTVNAEWLKKNFPCYWACPVHTEAGRYVNLIAQGRYEEAYRIARAPNPFASICGRICAAPCETACRRGELDKPIAIRALKRFVCERYGVESMIDIRRIHEALGPRIKPKNRWVAVIGSGPAGMSCAHDLALMGYSVTVFEKHDVPGGMLTLGVPEYRLPRELVRMEINAILSLGVELKLGKALGRDFTLQDLRENGYEAIFLGIGAHKSRDLQIEGVELDGVLRAVDFLLNINMGYKVDLGEKILVIGGGNVAIDVARTAARQERIEEMASDITEALDVARSAVRFGAKEVHMVVLESRDEMLASEEEIQEALEERIHIHNSLGPKRILGKNGKVTGLETIRCTSVFDENGRFNPQFAPGTEQVMEADSIIMAIGQASDLSFIQPEDGIEVTPRNTIKVDPQTLATTAPGIYAGGDVSFGPRIAIDAVADGRRAARSIDEFLTGEKREEKKVYLTVYDTFDYEQQPDFEKIDRVPIPALPIDRRVGVAQVELGYTEEQAVLEARRCLRCWINTVFEPRETSATECILCGGCVDICPENCIELVSLKRLISDPEAMAALERSEDFILGRGQTDSGEEVEGAVMIKDETICIRCGLCAKRCPVDCIKMEGFEIEERVAYEG